MLGRGDCSLTVAVLIRAFAQHLEGQAVQRTVRQDNQPVGSQHLLADGLRNEPGEQIAHGLGVSGRP